jgi:hypothetical protein
MIGKVYEIPETRRRDDFSVNICGWMFSKRNLKIIDNNFAYNKQTKQYVDFNK